MGVLKWPIWILFFVFFFFFGNEEQDTHTSSLLAAVIPETPMSPDVATIPHLSIWTYGPKQGDVTAWHPHRMLMVPKNSEQRPEMCMRMGSFFSVQQNEQLGSWEEMLLYHYSFCVTLQHLDSCQGVNHWGFSPCDETVMTFSYLLRVSFSSTIKLCTAHWCAAGTKEDKISTFSWISTKDNWSNFKTL